jgi:light-regulated signal transduction histidine kinase (bacteriophytochrome)
VKSGHSNCHENNVNTWSLLFAAIALLSATALAVVARRCVALQRRVAELAGELEGANGQLEIFTGAISEELQAPLRELHRLGRQPIQLERVDVGLVARDVVDELMPRYPRSKVTIGELPAARADRALFRVALLQLVDNALKFSASAQSPRIDIGGRAHDRDVEYWVRDNGTGFDMAHRHRLFEVFQRLHVADEFAGSGTGLAMVRLIVARHGGNVRAHARPGEGATFTILLPNVA